jgi:hypothetical protein
MKHSDKSPETASPYKKPRAPKKHLAQRKRLRKKIQQMFGNWPIAWFGGCLYVVDLRHPVTDFTGHEDTPLIPKPGKSATGFSGAQPRPLS